MEARIYADDPARGHLPSAGRLAGRLTEVVFPPGVRVDAWIATGTEVTTSYHPMPAKVIAHGADRAQALTRLARAALAATRIDGIETDLGCCAPPPALRRAPAAVPAPSRPVIADGGVLGRAEATATRPMALGTVELADGTAAKLTPPRCTPPLRAAARRPPFGRCAGPDYPRERRR